MQVTCELSHLSLMDSFSSAFACLVATQHNRPIESAPIRIREANIFKADIEPKALNFSAAGIKKIYLGQRPEYVWKAAEQAYFPKSSEHEKREIGLIISLCRFFENLNLFVMLLYLFVFTEC